MLHPALDRGLDQVARGGGIVAIVLERVGDRFRYHYRAGKMHDFGDSMLVDQAANQLDIAGIAGFEDGSAINGPIEACDQIIKHHNLFAGIRQVEHHVAADIPRPASNQYGHD
jgi:hypothetical protein